MASESGTKPRADVKFDGIFTLRTREDAEALSEAVRGMLEASVDLFFIIQTDPGVKKDLIADLETINRLLSDFPSLCLDDTNRKKAQESNELIGKASEKIIFTLNAHQDGQNLSTENETTTRSELQRIILSLCIVTEIMEDTQRIRSIRLVSNGFRHLSICKETNSDYRLTEKMKAMVTDIKAMLASVRRRVQVLGETEDSFILSDFCDVVERTLAPLVRATQSAVSSPTPENIQTRDGYIREMVPAFSSATKVLQKTHQSSGFFDFTSLSDALDALQLAIARGDRIEAVEQAKGITALLKSNPDFGEDRLKGLLQDLLELTKQELNDPQDGKGVENVIKVMKDEALTIQVKKKSSSQSSTMASLLNCAKDLSAGMKEMEQSIAFQM